MTFVHLGTSPLFSAMLLKFCKVAIGLRSGLWLGHSRILTLLFWSHSCVALALYLRSLSCWKINLLPRCSTLQGCSSSRLLYNFTVIQCVSVLWVELWFCCLHVLFFPNLFLTPQIWHYQVVCGGNFMWDADLYSSPGLLGKYMYIIRHEFKALQTNYAQWVLDQYWKSQDTLSVSPDLGKIML